MNILTPGLEFVAIPDPVICKSPLPNRKIRTQSMRKTSFDESHDSLDSNSLRSQQEMNMIRHDDKRVQLIVTLPTVLLERVQKQFGVRRNLKETAAIEGGAGHKVRPRPNGAKGDRHWKIVKPYLSPGMLNGWRETLHEWHGFSRAIHFLMRGRLTGCGKTLCYEGNTASAVPQMPCSRRGFSR